MELPRDVGEKVRESVVTLTDVAAQLRQVEAHRRDALAPLASVPRLAVTFRTAGGSALTRSVAQVRVEMQSPPDDNEWPSVESGVVFRIEEDAVRA